MVPDEEGKPFSVRYEEVNAMLLNEFLKACRKVETLEATVAREAKDFRDQAAKQQDEIETLTTALKAQAAQIQKVSDALAAKKGAPHLVLND